MRGLSVARRDQVQQPQSVQGDQFFCFRWSGGGTIDSAVDGPEGPFKIWQCQQRWVWDIFEGHDFLVAFLAASGVINSAYHRCSSLGTSKKLQVIPACRGTSNYRAKKSQGVKGTCSCNYISSWQSNASSVGPQYTHITLDSLHSSWLNFTGAEEISQVGISLALGSRVYF